MLLLVDTWGVGVVSLLGAPLSLPTLATPAFAEFFRLGRAMRVVLPLGDGGGANVFVVYGYQGAEFYPDKLALTHQLIISLLCEAKVCWSSQPTILVGDLNADPSLIPPPAKGTSDWGWVDLEKAFATGRGFAPTPT